MFISMYDTFTSPTFESNEDDDDEEDDDDDEEDDDEEDDNDDDEEDNDASVVVATSVLPSVLPVRRLDSTVLAFIRQIFRSSTFKIIIVIINILSSSIAKAT